MAPEEMILVGEAVKRNPKYRGTDHAKDYRKGNPDYYSEIGYVVYITVNDGHTFPVVEFPDASTIQGGMRFRSGYSNWQESLIRLDKGLPSLKQQGFDDELFEI